jgi:YrbI family 3-deoxy-D-manno-octulosonate 8-phosphate phosphatase
VRAKNIIAIIPARGGSKGIPGKNIIDFCGKPLLAWSILQAKEAETIVQVYVSSDDQHILNVATRYGAIPIHRPKELATDIAPSEQALIHALDEIERSTGYGLDLVVFLQATSPLREPEDIDGGVRRLLETESDSLFSMTVLEDFCVWTRRGSDLVGLTFDPFHRDRRQDREPLYLENGSIYVFRPGILRKYQNRLGGKISMLEMDFWKSYEIDKMEDIEICRYYFEKHLLPHWEKKQGHQKISISNIDLIVYDFDGVMTDNRVIVLQDGTEAIVANRADGLGVDRLRKLGIPQLVISTETNPVVKARATKLNLEVIGACEDKKIALRNYCEQKGYDLQRVVYIGNDLNDLEPMKIVGFPVAPSDAHPEVKAVAKLLIRAKGGQGVISELVDIILS